MKRILIIEDDPATAKGLETALREENYDTLVAMDGERGYQLAKGEHADLILLDLILPKKNGMDVCRDLRADGVTTPILMLTNRRDEIDEILGLEIGADDYVTKPFSLQRLFARIKNLLHRTGQLKTDIEDVAFGKVKIDFKTHEAAKDSKPVRFSVKELEVLKYFVLREGEVVTRDMLLTDVWGYEDEENVPTTRTIDNYILSIRKKIEDDPSDPKHILTVHTAGYKFVR